MRGAIGLTFTSFVMKICRPGGGCLPVEAVWRLAARNNRIAATKKTGSNHEPALFANVILIAAAEPAGSAKSATAKSTEAAAATTDAAAETTAEPAPAKSATQPAAAT
jgi:hypothetical protein